MEPHGSYGENFKDRTVQQCMDSANSKYQLQKRLERFKRKMNRRMEGSGSGRTTPVSSIGGPPSEYGRALSTVSVPAIMHHQAKVNSNAGNDLPREATDISKESEKRTAAARIQLVKSLMKENETLKSTLDQWAPAVSAYRTCHALVQELNKKVEERDEVISQLNDSLRNIDNRDSDAKLKLAEFERRMALKDAGTNQLKTKIIELKAQIETAQLTESELKRQLNDQSRMLEHMQQQQRGNAATASGDAQSQQRQQQQQQAAMAMMTMQLQRDMTECMAKLRQRDQEITALQSERDGLVDACNQLQQALQAATTAAVMPVSMEMSFKPPATVLDEKETQTETENLKAALLLGNQSVHSSSTAQIIQTDPFLLPSSSVEVQFSSIDLQPVVISLPDNVNVQQQKEKEENRSEEATQKHFVDSSCQYDNDNGRFGDKPNEDSAIVIDFGMQFPSEEDYVNDITAESDEVHTQTDVSTATSTNIMTALVCDAATQNDALLLKMEKTDFGAQTCCVATKTLPDNFLTDSSVQTDLLPCVRDTATDPVHSLFDMQNVVVQTCCDKQFCSVECQTSVEKVQTADMESQVGGFGFVCDTASDPILFVQHSEAQVDASLLRFFMTEIGSDPILYRDDAQVQADSPTPLANEIGCDPILFLSNKAVQGEKLVVSETGTNPDRDVLSEVDQPCRAEIGSDPIRFVKDNAVQKDFSSADANAMSFQHSATDGGAEDKGVAMTNVGCQTVLEAVQVAGLYDRSDSPSESILSLTSDCFSGVVLPPSASAEPQLQTPTGLLCPSEVDALRAAVRLLSREKRDLQSRLAHAAKQSSRAILAPEASRTFTPIMKGSSPSPSRFIAPSTPSSSTSNDGVHSSLSAIQRKISELREQLSSVNQQPISPTSTS